MNSSSKRALSQFKKDSAVEDFGNKLVFAVEEFSEEELVESESCILCDSIYEFGSTVKKFLGFKSTADMNDVDYHNCDSEDQDLTLGLGF